jgi:hypothetical protein
VQNDPLILNSRNLNDEVGKILQTLDKTKNIQISEQERQVIIENTLIDVFSENLELKSCIEEMKAAFKMKNNQIK